MRGTSRDALSTAEYDQLNKPKVICSSWGNREDYWTQQSMECFDQLPQKAGLLGITVILLHAETTDRATASRTAEVMSPSRHRARTL
jgi:hypothetical protein